MPRRTLDRYSIWPLRGRVPSLSIQSGALAAVPAVAAPVDDLDLLALEGGQGQNKVALLVPQPRDHRLGHRRMGGSLHFGFHGASSIHSPQVGC